MKKYFITEIEEVLEGEIAKKGAIATDRIMVEGSRIFFCYREEPSNEFNDSGWRFFSGDEEDEYLNNSDNVDIYSLNTICNYDEDIIELLNAPINSAFERNEFGDFVEVKDFFDNE